MRISNKICSKLIKIVNSLIKAINQVFKSGVFAEKIPLSLLKGIGVLSSEEILARSRKVDELLRADQNNPTLIRKLEFYRNLDTAL